MKKIAVFTSGGDAPGMNACIRAVVRAGLYHKIEMVGILQGYAGMIEGNFQEMESNSVSNIIQQGGTILKSARSQEFRTPEGRAKAYKKLKDQGIDGIVAIGGDGTFTGATQLIQEFDIPVVGAPGTIDNDLYGTDYTIGFDTAVNTALDAIDKIRDTADAFNRIFFIEVMGRDTGFIAVEVGVGGGAEAIMIPETDTSIEALVEMLKLGWRKNKASSIVIVAEGDEEGGAHEIIGKVKQQVPSFDGRAVVLGHIQRGGRPTALDRMLASRIGVACVEALMAGQNGVMVGVVNNKIEHTPFKDAINKRKPISTPILKLVEVLSS